MHRENQPPGPVKNHMAVKTGYGRENWLNVIERPLVTICVIEALGLPCTETKTLEQVECEFDLWYVYYIVV